MKNKIPRINISLDDDERELIIKLRYVLDTKEKKLSSISDVIRESLYALAREHNIAV